MTRTMVERPADEANDRALADSARYSGAPSSMARLPMTPEEVVAVYDAAEAAEDTAKAAVPGR